MRGIRGQRHCKRVKAPARQTLNPFITWTDFTDTQPEKRKDSVCCCLLFNFRSETVMTLQKWLQCLLLCKGSEHKFPDVLCNSYHHQTQHLSGWTVLWKGRVSHRVVLLKQQWASALCSLGWLFCALKANPKNSMYQDPIKPNFIPSNHSEKLGPILGHLNHVWEICASPVPACLLGPVGMFSADVKKQEMEMCFACWF